MTAVMAPATTGRRAIAVLGEDTEGPPDEAYVSFTRHLVVALRSHCDVVDVSIDHGGGHRRRTGGAGDVARLRRAAATAREAAADTLIYCSRSSCTVPALLRARLLELFAPDLQVAFVALQPRTHPWLKRRLERTLWPDLLLVGTAAERDLLRQSGAAVEIVSGGVDLDRFRPAADAGERVALRRTWQLPPEGDIVLHVGHATVGRNLGALAPLTALPGTTLLLVLSSRGRPEATPVVEDLRRRGAIVRQGYLPRVEELFRASDCYVMPTLSTDWVVGLPLSVIEALASDLPVVATGVGAIPEQFSGHAGVRLVGCDQELRDGVLAQLAARPSTRHLAAPFGWQAQVDRILHLLRPPAPRASAVP